MRLTLNQKRLGVGLLTVFGSLSGLNYLAGWNIFGRFDKQVMIGTLFLLFLHIFFVGPSIEEIHEYRANKHKDSAHVLKDGTENAPGLWKYLLPLVAVMISMIFVGDGFGLITGEPVPSEHWMNVAFIELLLLVAGVVGWLSLKKLGSSDVK